MLEMLGAIRGCRRGRRTPNSGTLHSARRSCDKTTPQPTVGVPDCLHRPQGQVWGMKSGAAAKAERTLWLRKQSLAAIIGPLGFWVRF